MKRIFLLLLLLLAVPISSAEAAYLQESAPLLPQEASVQFKADLAKAPQTNTFAKVGDSNSEMLQNIYALGCGNVKLDSYSSLQPTLDRYKVKAPSGSAACKSKNSFSHTSASTRSSSPSSLALSTVVSGTTGLFWRDPLCGLSETYLACELRLSRPKYVFITTGTNDASWNIPLASSRANILAIVAAVRAANSVPVLTTITPITLPERAGTVGPMNDMIIALAKEQGVPLVNNWRAVAGLASQGLRDGLHLNYYGSDPLASSADFTARGLRYGANARNLLFLRALQKLDTLAP